MLAVPAVLAAAVTVADVSGSAGSPASGELPRPQPDANSGRFVAIGGEMHSTRFACISCHGADGQGDASGAFPRLAGQSGWYLYRSLGAFASGIRPSQVMGPIAAELDDAAMQAVAAYYSGLDQTPVPPQLAPDDQAIAMGRSIATAGLAGQSVPACAMCHGAEGRSNSPVAPSLAGQFAPYIEQQLERWKAGKRGGDPMNIMRQIAANMSQSQMHAAAAYFASVSPSGPSADQTELRSGTGVSPPDPLPLHTGVVIDPEPGRGDVVLPRTGDDPAAAAPVTPE